jgi:hypothetical protein
LLRIFRPVITAHLKRNIVFSAPVLYAFRDTLFEYIDVAGAEVQSDVLMDRWFDLGFFLIW